MARAGLLDQGSHSTSGKSRGWPTPNRMDGMEVKEKWTPEEYDERERQKKAANPKLGELQRSLEIEAKRHSGRGVLNSRWVAQLMNYPSDWCELPSDVLDALTAKPSKPTATRSCPPSSPSSGKRSSKLKPNP